MYIYVYMYIRVTIKKNYFFILVLPPSFVHLYIKVNYKKFEDNQLIFRGCTNLGVARSFVP